MIFISVFTFLALVISGHYFAWFLVMRAWPQWQKQRFWVLGVFIGITIIFLGDFIWLHQSDSIILATLYVVGAVLFGLLTQLMLFGIVFWLRHLILKYWTWARLHCLLPDPRSTARIFLILAVVFFLLGTYNAFFPRVKTIELTGWPAELSGLSFVQLSDLHLGAVYRPAYVRQVLRKVNATKADFVIISGDLFDGSDEKLSEFIPVLQEFSSPTIFVPGNHDYYADDKEVFSTVNESGLLTLSDQAQMFFGVEVIGFNYLDRADSNLQREINNLKIEKESPRIVINHVPVDQAEAKDLAADLMLSGHTHRGQIFPFSLFTTYLYGRFAYGLENYEGMTTYTSAGTATWGPPLRTLFPGEIVKFVIE